MLKQRMILIISLIIVGLFCSSVFLHADPLINLSKNSSLSPGVVINKSDFKNKSFFKRQKHTTFQKALADKTAGKPLKELLGEHSVKSVLDVATGNGQWIRDIKKHDWISSNAKILGLELENPTVYPGQRESIIEKEKDWQGLKIIHSEDHPDFPKKDSLDLLHESFIHTDGISDHTIRLKKYDNILKPGGWLIIAHVQHKNYVEKETFIEWLTSKSYDFEVFESAYKNVPEDYPTTYWWDFFDRGFLLGQHFAYPYLIVAKKTMPKSMDLNLAYNTAIERSL